MSRSLAEYLAEVRRAIPTGERQEYAQSTASINDTVDLSTYRLLAPQEKAVIEALLNQSGPKEHAFLPQLEDMMVQRRCTCGCPSLAFAPPPDGTRIDLYHRNIVAEMTGEAMDGLVGVILWQAWGQLTGLEAYDLAGREPPTPYQLPRAETLATFSNA